jgi:hypothetical protein
VSRGAGSARSTGTRAGGAIDEATPTRATTRCSRSWTTPGVDTVASGTGSTAQQQLRSSRALAATGRSAFGPQQHARSTTCDGQLHAGRPAHSTKSRAMRRESGRTVSAVPRAPARGQSKACVTSPQRARATQHPSWLTGLLPAHGLLPFRPCVDIGPARHRPGTDTSRWTASRCPTTSRATARPCSSCTAASPAPSTASARSVRRSTRASPPGRRLPRHPRSRAAQARRAALGHGR